MNKWVFIYTCDFRKRHLLFIVLYMMSYSQAIITQKVKIEEKITALYLLVYLRVTTGCLNLWLSRKRIYYRHIPICVYINLHFKL
jgi:hypothetical protein